MQAEELACRKIVLRDVFRGPFHTAFHCESGTVYEARVYFKVLPLRPVLYSRLLVGVNAKSFLCEFCIQGLPAVKEKSSIHLTYTVKHLQEVLSFNKTSSERGGWSGPLIWMNRSPEESNKEQQQIFAVSTTGPDTCLQKKVNDSSLQFVRWGQEALLQLISVPFIWTRLQLRPPWLKIQRLHLQNPLMSGLRVNINYPGVSNTSSWIFHY